MSRRPRRTPPERRAASTRSARVAWLRRDAAAPPERAGRLWTWALWSGVALFAIAALVLIFRPERVGDVMAETDFYGGYGPGARLIQQGHLDPRRYAVVGPLFEVVLALAGFVIRDLYLAATLISLAGSVVALALWGDLLRRRAGAPLAAITVLFLALNATWFRYAWSATTDALALGLQALAIWLLCAPRTSTRPLAIAGLAGLVSAAAFLTRYTSVALLPAALLAIALGWAPVVARARRRAVVAYVAGFAALIAPWIAYSLAHGGAFQVQLHHNLAYDVFARAQGIPWDTYQQKLQPQFPTPWSVFARDPGAVTARLLFNTWDHLRLDAFDPVGVALATTALFGVALLARFGGGSALAPLLAFAACVSLSLVPAFHSPRYALPMLPAWAALAAAFCVSPRFALPLGPRGPWLKGVVALCVAAALLRTNVAAGQRVFSQYPVEVTDAARRARPLLRPGDRVIARKPHFAWVAGIEPVPFPFADSLRTLALAAREARARWLWFSWPEAETRPQFWFLLDTTSHVPGLTPRVVTDRHAAVLYEIGPGFGASPAWADDPVLARVHDARGRARVLDHDADSRLFLALHARDQGDPQAAQALLEQVLTLRPESARLWVLSADNLLRCGRTGEAVVALDRADRLAPGDPLARATRGWAALLAGRPGEAAMLWQPVIEATGDTLMLERMARLFAERGQADAAARARTQLEAVISPAARPAR